MNIKITNLEARSLLDSRNRPTIEVTAYTQSHSATFSVPSGASTGLHEAVELRDDDGGVQSAIANVNGLIRDALIGQSATEQSHLDKILIDLDGTKQKSNLGGNALLAVSGACCRLGALSLDMLLWKYLESLSGASLTSNHNLHLFVNLINGGKHAADAGPFQEHQVIVSGKSIQESITIAQSIQQTLRSYLDSTGTTYGIGDEGGFVFKYDSVETPFQILCDISDQLDLADSVVVGADIAASSFYEHDCYHVFDEKLSPVQLIDLYKNLHKNYQLNYIEDPFHEEDFKNFSMLRQSLPNVMVIGDDLTTTSSDRLEIAIQHNGIDALIIKPNQIGTITETLDTIDLAHKHNIKPIISHRSGETNDSFIADLAMGTKAFGIKAGAWGQPVREAKYDRLLEIEGSLNL